MWVANWMAFFPMVLIDLRQQTQFAASEGVICGRILRFAHAAERSLTETDHGRADQIKTFALRRVWSNDRSLILTGIKERDGQFLGDSVFE